MHNIPDQLLVVTILRRSKKEQADSIDRQRDLIASLIKRHNMRVRYEVVLDDHSATQGRQWESLYNIIERHKNGEPIQALVSSEYSRIARTMDEAEQYYLDLSQNSIFLITHKEGMLSGRDAWVMRNAAAAANERFAENLGVSISSGIMALMKRGMTPHSPHAPFGVDRLFLSSKGEKLFILRVLPDKSVVKLNAHDGTTVMEHFVGESRYMLPKRQKSERVIFIPGDPAHVAVVRRIFHLRYCEGYSVFKILLDLAATLAPSPSGDKWRLTTVKAILANECYTGVAILCKRGFGVHSIRRSDGPVIFPAPRRIQNDIIGRKRKKLQTIRRDKRDWMALRCPGLANFLPRTIRRAAKCANRQRRHAKLGSPVSQHGVGSGKFFLTGLIYSTQAKSIMHGNSKSTVSAQGIAVTYRFYRPIHCVYSKHRITRLSADAAEDAFLSIVSDLLRQNEKLELYIQRHVTDCIKSQSGRNDRLAALLAERKEREEHLAWIMNAGPKAQAAGADKRQALEARIEAIDFEVASERVRDGFSTTAEAPKIVKAVLAQLDALREAATSKSVKVLRRLALLMCDEIVFDPTTRLCTFKVRLPQQVIRDPAVLPAFFGGQATGVKFRSLLAKNASDIKLSTCVFRLHSGVRGRAAFLEPV